MASPFVLTWIVPFGRVCVFVTLWIVRVPCGELNTTMSPAWMLLAGVPCVIIRSPTCRAGLMLPEATVTKGVLVAKSIWRPK